MEKSIWKFPLEIKGTVKVEMPEGAEILSLQMQEDVPTIWALVDPKARRENREFEIHGTGFPVYPDVMIEKVFLATVQTSNGYVYHVFQRFSKHGR
jgi:hypothetical protein